MEIAYILYELTNEVLSFHVYQEIDPPTAFL